MWMWMWDVLEQQQKKEKNKTGADKDPCTSLYKDQAVAETVGSSRYQELAYVCTRCGIAQKTKYVPAKRLATVGLARGAGTDVVRT